MIYDMIYIC